jgi:hypothetical protein
MHHLLHFTRPSLTSFSPTAPIAAATRTKRAKNITQNGQNISQKTGRNVFYRALT